MKHIDLSGIRLSHIKMFLEAVECGSFTIAAEKMHVTQPYISKAIAHLEQELELSLFIRGNRTLQVTPAGRRLCQDWKMMIQNLEISLTTAHAIQSGITDKLQVGVGQLNGENGLLLGNLKKTKEEMPGLDLVVEYNDMKSLLNSLLSGMTDLIVISGHMLPVIERLELDWKTLIETNLAVYVHKTNPLYRKKDLEFADLQNEKFIVFFYENDNSYMQLLQKLSQEAGFLPKIACYVPNELSFRANLELGNGIVLADSFTALESPNVRRFDLKLRNDIIAVWKPKNKNKCICKFLSLFSETG